MECINPINGLCRWGFTLEFPDVRRITENGVNVRCIIKWDGVGSYLFPPVLDTQWRLGRFRIVMSVMIMVMHIRQIKFKVVWKFPTVSCSTLNIGYGQPYSRFDDQITFACTCCTYVCICISSTRTHYILGVVASFNACYSCTQSGRWVWLCTIHRPVESICSTADVYSNNKTINFVKSRLHSLWNVFLMCFVNIL